MNTKKQIMLNVENYKELKENLILKLINKYNQQDYNDQEQMKKIIEYCLQGKLDNKIYRTIYNTMKKKANKTYRLRKLIKKMFEEYEEPIFITLTFDEKNVNMKQHRKRIQEYLNKQCEYYVANIDYGKENERMHYHAVGSNKIDPTSWKYGNCDVKKIHTKNEKALSEYITKLSQHATKTTTKQERILTKRRKKK